MHCALYVFYEANKDDYYNRFIIYKLSSMIIINIHYSDANQTWGAVLVFRVK